ncbi:MAG: hypothetical protein MUE60_11490 [Candidatus Eisenbacteria bacterium]|jgi:hypothetical protein|nr:hypothetical protein [Candidatus Eisenbacteria bacterium]
MTMAMRQTVERRTAELRVFAERFCSPADIQVFLNQTPYSTHHACHSPYCVIRRASAHCAEGAYFAAAMLRLAGHPPLVMDLRAEQDDDHVIAPFRVNGKWGAIAKSNTTMLRYREPLYRTLRELVMSYFEMYFNIRGLKSLRAYSRPVSLARFDPRGWMAGDEDLEYIGDFLTALPHTQVLHAREAAACVPADPDLMRACFSVADPAGLFIPKDSP